VKEHHPHGGDDAKSCEGLDVSAAHNILPVRPLVLRSPRRIVTNDGVGRVSVHWVDSELSARCGLQRFSPVSPRQASYQSPRTGEREWAEAIIHSTR
jgi:hypothetical protein